MKLDWSQTVRSAEEHLSRGKITAAIEEYRKLVNWDPTDLSALNALGDLYARAGLNADATQIFSRVAQGYRHQGFTLKEIAVLKKLLRIDPSDLDSASGLAACYLGQGLRGEASRQYADVAVAYRRAGREDKALDAYQRLAEIDPSNTSLLMTLGERWLSEGQKQRAHDSFVAAGGEYSRQGDDERALTAYLRARTIQPDEYKTLEAISSICTARGQADRAIPILCDSLARKSGDAELHKLLGATYLSAGRLADAEATFQRLLALDADEYRNFLIVAERFLKCGDLDRAVDQINVIVDQLIANRDEQEAVAVLRKALECDPEHSASLRMLALIFRRVHEDINLEFVPADEVDDAASFSPPALLPPANPSAATADFELIRAVNRRRTTRISARVPLVVISDSGGWREFTETVDVGEAGLKLQLAHSTPPMTTLRLSFELAKWPEAVVRFSVVKGATGIVRHCNPLPGRPNLVGVELQPSSDPLVR